MSFSEPIIDCDVHNAWRSPEEFYPYLSPAWREYVLGNGRVDPVPVTASLAYTQPVSWYRDDEVVVEGSTLLRPSPEATGERLLDRYNIERAILTYEELIYVANIPNPYFAAEIARATNDWVVDHWLDVDPRFYGSIIVANQLPELAAAEVRRVAANPRFVTILMANNGLGLPMGHPMFHPIYEAAAEAGLPVALHSFQSGGVNPVETAAGRPNFYIEYHTLVSHGVMTTLVSFIANGVFEKFPTLKLVLMEGGLGWLPSVMWRMDAAYAQLREELPWLKQRPSEYVRNHVRLSTQPLEVSPKSRDLASLLDDVGAEDLLMFASDFPHWDQDEAAYIGNRLPRTWLPKVMRENALSTFRWPTGNGAPGVDASLAQLGRS